MIISFMEKEIKEKNTISTKATETK